MRQESRRVGVEPLRVSRNGKRFFSEGHKRAVVEKCLVPGASISAVALAHGFNANLVRKWIVKYQAARALTHTALVPVSMITARKRYIEAAAGAARKRAPELPGGSIEIEVGAARVLLRGNIDAEQLRVVLNALGVWR